MPLIHINDLIKQNFSRYPDFMSIDIEGLDFEVLKSLDFEIYPISVICVETCFYSESHIRPKDNRIIDFMLSKGYEIYANIILTQSLLKRTGFMPKSESILILFDGDHLAYSPTVIQLCHHFR